MTPLTPSSSLSASLVGYLREQGMTLRDIGAMVGLSESFISRVANGERIFTIQHLEVFESKLGQPLPALLLEAMWGRDLDARQRPAFDKALRLLQELGEFRRSLSVDETDDHSAADQAGHGRVRANGKRSRATG
jgi:transcriptional regulator with XRE-family HTH domain